MQKNKKNILHIGKFDFDERPGGIERVIKEMATYAAKNGFNVSVLCHGNKFLTQTEIKQGNIKYIKSGRLFNINSAPISPFMPFLTYKLSKKVDIIHLHHPDPLATISVLISGTKSKIILHWHSDIIRQKIANKIYYPILKSLLRKANIIITTSPEYAKSSKQLRSFIDKVVTVPLSVSIDKSTTKQKPYILQKLKDKKIIFALGRLVYYKGFEYLINAAQFLSDDFIILIGGDGPERKRLEKIVNKKGLKEKVMLIGNIPENDLRHYFDRADLFCLPSINRAEAFGLVLLQAMQCATPLVTTNIPGSGTKWVNQNNYTGYVVEPRNHKAIAVAINKILKNDQLTHTFGKNSKTRFDLIFSPKKTYGRLIKIYKSI